MKPEYNVNVGIVEPDGLWRVRVLGTMHRPEADKWRQCALASLLGGRAVPTSRVLDAIKQCGAPGPTARWLLDACARYPTGEVDFQRRW